MPWLLVQGPSEFSVGSPGGCEFFGAFFELTLNGSEVLLQHGDPSLELIDVRGGAEPGFGPGCFAEG